VRAREAIESDLEILTWPHVVLDAAVVYDRLLRDVEPLLTALGVAERRVGLLEAERDPRVLDEVRDLWKRALTREGNLAAAVADVVWKAAQFGETDDGDTMAYIVPKGCLHRLVGVAQQNGAHVPVAFRAQHVPAPADDDFANLLAAFDNERSIRLAAESRAGVAEAALARVESAHSKLHGRCDNPICPLRAALAPTPEPTEAK
jgi:hypothetical protein